ncbi:PREDICTED: nuclear transcription factor Y subunit B-7-like [Nicotiana attenuata]|uniref:Nuclear transcription factor y subunit b-7 n=1 Tax=Nicotiana attenuata TaxID=49451 RepID=A0A1J6IX43_NICAT|nr:PREDICTED: nuclear transcription factor Y subunit B-7-like [Nicotiana attenuata]OIT03355.1 nuclear transcription factor y subunit b-7 [Nicotiana attenuata]
MEDDKRGILPNVAIKRSPENNSNITIQTTPITTTTTTSTFTNNCTNIKTENNNNNNKCSSSSSNNNNNNSKEQDRFLPIANVGRIMKKVIPGNGKISKDAKETVQECVSEFISFVTGEASDKCQREKRKTINGDDIIWAIGVLGFDEYVNPLKQYLNKYRELEGEKLNVPNKQHQQQQQQQQLHDHAHSPSLPNYNSVYNSPSGLGLPQPSFVSTDQSFPLPLISQNSIQSQLSQQEQQIDSVGHW